MGLLKRKLATPTGAGASSPTAEAGPPPLETKMAQKRAMKRERELVQALRSLQITEETTPEHSGCKRMLLSSMVDSPGGGRAASSKHGGASKRVIKGRMKRAWRAPSPAGLAECSEDSSRKEDLDGNGYKEFPVQQGKQKTKSVDEDVPRSRLSTCSDESKSKEKKTVRRPSSESGGPTGIRL
ncbi:hypothetical protein V5799_007425 [Amblyomma americanum]|uniref:Uncharacterized protein n=1 Tax=Amblyomma americanum TaxID=6943 RepID=A0AAQ4FHZ0_AMBAM